MKPPDDDPMGPSDRSMMWSLAGAWVRGRPRNGSGSRLIDSSVESFTAIEESAVRHTEQRLSPPFDLGTAAGWIIGRSVGGKGDVAVPVATVQLDGNSESITRCCIRVALFRERGDGTVDTTGWRFELAETGDDPLHPYQHAQQIVGWATASTCLLHPPDLCPDECDGLDRCGEESIDVERTAAINRVNQSHPAFPFATRTLTGLIASTMATLYGSRIVRELIEVDTRVSRASGAVADDLNTLRG